MFAGDASYLNSTMLNGTVDGVSPNETEATATLAAIRTLCARASDHLSADARSKIGREAE